MSSTKISECSMKEQAYAQSILFSLWKNILNSFYLLCFIRKTNTQIMSSTTIFEYQKRKSLTPNHSFFHSYLLWKWFWKLITQHWIKCWLIMKLFEWSEKSGTWCCIQLSLIWENARRRIKPIFFFWKLAPFTLFLINYKLIDNKRKW